jgi:hypothetical protein
VQPELCEDHCRNHRQREVHDAASAIGDDDAHCERGVHRAGPHAKQGEEYPGIHVAAVVAATPLLHRSFTEIARLKHTSVCSEFCCRTFEADLSVVEHIAAISDFESHVDVLLDHENTAAGLVGDVTNNRE